MVIEEDGCGRWMERSWGVLNCAVQYWGKSTEIGEVRYGEV